EELTPQQLRAPPIWKDSREIAHYVSLTNWFRDVKEAFLRRQFNKLFALLTHEPFHAISRSNFFAYTIQTISITTAFTVLFHCLGSPSVALGLLPIAMWMVGGGEGANRASTQFFIDIMNDKDEKKGVREEAISKLGLIRNKQSARALIAFTKIKRQNKELRSTAIAALGENGSNECVRYLKELLNNKRWKLDAATALLSTKSKNDPAVIAIILRKLKSILSQRAEWFPFSLDDADWIEILREKKPPAIIEWLKDIVSSKINIESDVYKNAAHLLADIGDPLVIDYFVGLFKEAKRQHQRFKDVRARGGYGDGDIYDYIDLSEETKKDLEKSIDRLIGVLIKVGDAKAKRCLRELVQDKFARPKATLALAKLKDEGDPEDVAPSQSLAADLFTKELAGRYAWLLNLPLRIAFIFATPVHELGHILGAKLHGQPIDWEWQDLFTGNIDQVRGPPRYYGTLACAIVAFAAIYLMGLPVIPTWAINLSAYIAATNAVSAAMEIGGIFFDRGDFAAEKPIKEEVEGGSGDIIYNSPELSNMFPKLPELPERKILNVPKVKQLPFHCGPASLSMVLAYYGISMDQEEVATMADLDPEDGVFPPKLAECVRGFGYVAKEFHELSIPEVISIIGNKEIPLIVRIKSFKREEGYAHLIVIKGYDLNERILYINDPNDLDRERIDFDSFEKKWVVDNYREKRRWKTKNYAISVEKPITDYGGLDSEKGRDAEKPEAPTQPSGAAPGEREEPSEHGLKQAEAVSQKDTLGEEPKQDETPQSTIQKTAWTALGTGMAAIVSAPFAVFGIIPPSVPFGLALTSAILFIHVITARKSLNELAPQDNRAPPNIFADSREIAHYTTFKNWLKDVKDAFSNRQFDKLFTLITHEPFHAISRSNLFAYPMQALFITGLFAVLLHYIGIAYISGAVLAGFALGAAISGNSGALSEKAKVVYREGGVKFLRREETFNRSQGKSVIGTMLALPGAVRLDIYPMENAHGNLTIYDRGEGNVRSYQPGPDSERIEDSKRIRESFVPFNIAMEQVLKENPACAPLTWIDNSNNFGNPDFITFSKGRLYYPTGYSCGQVFEQSFAEPFFSVVQLPDGNIDMGHVYYEIERTERIEEYYDRVYARAYRAVENPLTGTFIKGEELPPDIRAFTGICIVANHKKTNLEQAVRKGVFQDLRLLFRFPIAKHNEYPQVPENIRAGIPIGLGELAADNYRKASEALTQPVRLKAEIVVSAHERIALNKEQMRNLLKKAKYNEQTELSVGLKEGEFRFIDDDYFEVFIQSNPYPIMLFGRTKDNEIFIESIGGKSGWTGMTVKDLFDYVDAWGLKDLMLLSAGTGAFLGYIPDEFRGRETRTDEDYYRPIVAPSEGRIAGSCSILILLNKETKENLHASANLQPFQSTIRETAWTTVGVGAAALLSLPFAVFGIIPAVVTLGLALTSTILFIHAITARKSLEELTPQQLRAPPIWKDSREIAHYVSLTNWLRDVKQAFLRRQFNKLFALLTHEPFHAISRSNLFAYTMQIVLITAIIVALFYYSDISFISAGFSAGCLFGAVLGGDKDDEINKLIDQLRDSNLDVSQKAALALGERGPEAAPAIPDLIAKLGAGGQMSWLAAFALGKIGELAIPAVVETLENSGDSYVRWHAVLALCNMGPEAAPAVPALRKALKDPELSYTRWHAAIAFSNIDPQKAAPAMHDLIEALGDTSTHVTWNAALALGRIGGPAVPELMKIIVEDSMSLWASVAAILALSEIGPKAAPAIPILIEKLSDTDASEKGLYTRRYAAFALGEIGDSRAVEALLEVLGDKAFSVRKAAIEALSKICDYGKLEFYYDTVESSWKGYLEKEFREKSEYLFGEELRNSLLEKAREREEDIDFEILLRAVTTRYALLKFSLDKLPFILLYDFRTQRTKLISEDSLSELVAGLVEPEAIEERSFLGGWTSKHKERAVRIVERFTQVYNERLGLNIQPKVSFVIFDKPERLRIVVASAIKDEVDFVFNMRWWSFDEFLRCANSSLPYAFGEVLAQGKIDPERSRYKLPGFEITKKGLKLVVDGESTTFKIGEFFDKGTLVRQKQKLLSEAVATFLANAYVDRGVTFSAQEKEKSELSLKTEADAEKFLFFYQRWQATVEAALKNKALFHPEKILVAIARHEARAHESYCLSQKSEAQLRGLVENFHNLAKQIISNMGLVYTKQEACYNAYHQLVLAFRYVLISTQVEFPTRSKIPFDSAIDFREVALFTAREIFSLLWRNPEAVIGLATGSTMPPVYVALVDYINDFDLDLSEAPTFFNLDEYYYSDIVNPQIYRNYMEVNFYSQISNQLHRPRLVKTDYVDGKIEVIEPGNAYLPEAPKSEEALEAYCQWYEDQIQKHGGIHLQLLGIGRGEYQQDKDKTRFILDRQGRRIFLYKGGHIGFNEPPELDLGLSQNRLPEIVQETLLAVAREKEEIHSTLSARIIKKLLRRRSVQKALEEISKKYDGCISLEELKEMLLFFASNTRKVELSFTTIKANQEDFSTPGVKSAISAVSMGLGSILRAKKIILLAAGPEKVDVVNAAANGYINPLIPATILQVHPNVKFMLDSLAAEPLLKNPFRFTPQEWVVHILFELSLEKQKPISELTDEEILEDARISKYLKAAQMTAEQAKSYARDALQQKLVRVLPKHTLVVATQPHPDDVAICVGGLIGLLSKDMMHNDVRILTATNGYTAVWDCDQWIEFRDLKEKVRGDLIKQLLNRLWDFEKVHNIKPFVVPDGCEKDFAPGIRVLSEVKELAQEKIVDRYKGAEKPIEFSLDNLEKKQGANIPEEDIRRLEKAIPLLNADLRRQAPTYEELVKLRYYYWHEYKRKLRLEEDKAAALAMGVAKIKNLDLPFYLTMREGVKDQATEKDFEIIRKELKEIFVDGGYMFATRDQRDKALKEKLRQYDAHSLTEEELEIATLVLDYLYDGQTNEEIEAELKRLGKSITRDRFSAILETIKKEEHGLLAPVLFLISDDKDPMGTHGNVQRSFRKCVDELLRQYWLLKPVAFIHYHGAWGEYPAAYALARVMNFSQEINDIKQASIKRHRSQDPPKFPGDDPRSFHERALDVNTRNGSNFKTTLTDKVVELDYAEVFKILVVTPNDRFYLRPTPDNLKGLVYNVAAVPVTLKPAVTFSVPPDRCTLLSDEIKDLVHTTPFPKERKVALIEIRPNEAGLFAGILLNQLETRGNSIACFGFYPNADIGGLKKQLAEFNPDILLLPQYEDKSQENVAMRQQIAQVLTFLNRKGPKIAVGYETPMRIFNYNLFCPLTQQQWQVVMKAMGAHTSQMERVAYDQAVEAQAKANAILVRELLEPELPQEFEYVLMYRLREVASGQLRDLEIKERFILHPKDIGNLRSFWPTNSTVIGNAPHPDDTEIALGAPFSILTKLNSVYSRVMYTGYRVVIGGVDEKARVAKIRLRVTEAKLGAQILGIDSQFLNHPAEETGLPFYTYRMNKAMSEAEKQRLAREEEAIVHEELQRLCAEHIRQRKDKFIPCIPEASDKHPDHRRSLTEWLSSLCLISREHDITMPIIEYVSPWAGDFNAYVYVDEFTPFVLESAIKEAADLIFAANAPPGGELILTGGFAGRPPILPRLAQRFKIRSLKEELQSIPEYPGQDTRPFWQRAQNRLGGISRDMPDSPQMDEPSQATVLGTAQAALGAGLAAAFVLKFWPVFSLALGVTAAILFTHAILARRSLNELTPQASRAPPIWKDSREIAHYTTFSNWLKDVKVAFSNRQFNKLFALLTHEPFHAISRSNLFAYPMQVALIAGLMTLLFYHPVIAFGLLPVAMTKRGEYRETLLRTEPDDNDFYQMLDGLYTDTETLLAKRRKAATMRQKRILTEETLSKLRPIKEWLGRYSRLIRRKGAMREIHQLRRKAYECTESAVRMIEGQNEPAALPALMHATIYIQKALERALDERLTRQEKMERVGYDAKDGKFRLTQQTYKLVGRALIPIGVYTPKKHHTLWQTFRALDNQRKTELDDRFFMNRAIECIELARRQIRRNRRVDLRQALGWIIKRLRPKRGDIKDKNKQLGRNKLEGAIEQYSPNDDKAVKSVEGNLGKTIDHFRSRIKRIDSILRSFERGHVRVLRAKAKTWNDQIHNLAKGARDALKAGMWDDVTSWIEEILKYRAINEPQYHGLMLLLERTLEAFRESKSEENIRNIDYNLLVIQKKAKVANTIAEFMSGFRSAWINECKQKRLQDPTSLEESIFKRRFTRFINGRRLTPGSPTIELWWTRFFQPAFIPTTIKPAHERAEAVDNPVFLAVNDLIVIQEVKDFGRLLKEYNSAPLIDTQAKKPLPCTYRLLRSFVEETGDDASRKKYIGLTRRQKEEILEALGRDYELNRAQIDKLYKAAFPPRLRRYGAAPTIIEDLGATSTG
ncbi:MAG: HEAT repeat domain-containing protein, partial [Candidatus Omnitrophica bacterium]|nr:HEAT repeat domain-containing protein [Candidatus Omnitrophota bacterium]